MAISDFVAESLERPIASVRRYAISLAVSAVSAIAALVYAASALLMALEAVLGPINARLIVAAILLAAAVAGFFAPRLLRPASRQSPASDPDLAALSRDQRIAMVLEALMLGFSMGSRKPADETDSGK
ncbi:MAG: hypothetical protein ACOY5F_15410 [Pseudomonadota bacterium]